MENEKPAKGKNIEFKNPNSVDETLADLSRDTEAISTLTINVSFSNEQIQTLCERLKRFPEAVIVLSEQPYGGDTGLLDNFIKEFLKYSIAGYLYAAFSPTLTLIDLRASWEKRVNRIYAINLRNAVLNEVRYILRDWSYKAAPSKRILGFLRSLIAYYMKELLEVEKRFQELDGDWLRWGESYSETALESYLGADLFIALCHCFEQFMILNPEQVFTDDQRTASVRSEEKFKFYYSNKYRYLDNKGASYLVTPLLRLIPETVRTLDAPDVTIVWPDIEQPVVGESNADLAKYVNEDWYIELSQSEDFRKNPTLQQLRKEVMKKIVATHTDSSKEENDEKVKKWNGVKDLIDGKDSAAQPKEVKSKSIAIELLKNEMEKEKASYALLNERYQAYQKNKGALYQQYAALKDQLTQTDEHVQLRAETQRAEVKRYSEENRQKILLAKLRRLQKKAAKQKEHELTAPDILSDGAPAIIRAPLTSEDASTSAKKKRKRKRKKPAHKPL